MYHKARASGKIELRTVYIDSSVASNLPNHCATVPVSDLLRALILEAVKLPSEYDEDSRGGKIMSLLLDEVKTNDSPPLHVPMPEEPRIRKVCEALLDDPSVNHTLSEWGRTVGAGERTLARLFKKETGMTFGRWRQQVRILKAVDLLASGQPVARISEQVGYTNPAAFSQMFRKAMGASPTEYLG
jgi:AraC-like DNA-binding protein